ncbi:unnamed protein product, partial [Linum tenue]
FPLTYTPLILFYANPETPNLQSTDRFIAHLKRSLAETLTVYYPFSGRTDSGNLLIDRFGESIPFIHVKVFVFACGGIALGWAASHKLIDGFTMISFLKAFSAVSRGGRERAEILSTAPALFRLQSDGNPLVYKRKLRDPTIRFRFRVDFEAESRSIG